MTDLWGNAWPRRSNVDRDITKETVDSMDTIKTSVVGISASPSLHSRTAALVEHVLSRLPASLQPSHLKLSELDPAALTRALTNDTSINRAARAIESADALVVATPIFKASFSGLLKTFLDLLPQYALAGKVILPLATGESPAHVLALDYALRPVLQSMGARHVIQSVFVRSADISLGAHDVKIASDSAILLNEAILHFEHALQPLAKVTLLGHPRPNRFENSPILSAVD